MLSISKLATSDRRRPQPSKRPSMASRFSAKRVGVDRTHELLTLLHREPAVDRLSEPFYALDPADTRHQLRAEQATVRRLIGQSADRRQTEVYRCRSQGDTLQVHPIAQDDDSIQGQPGS